ncbi:MAG TPA: hypothetical protein VFM18_14305, partial [Methanosarcina sp.]|nr:hypothetical protein [Methanosarcina sp.]
QDQCRKEIAIMAKSASRQVEGLYAIANALDTLGMKDASSKIWWVIDEVKESMEKIDSLQNQILNSQLRDAQASMANTLVVGLKIAEKISENKP